LNPLNLLNLLNLLFFLSGFSALVYQVVWLRLLSLTFGVTVYAASAVLTSFMGGLALGSWLGGRLADRIRRPLAAFGVVELLIAASALAVPFQLDLAGALYAAIHARVTDGFFALTAARVICSGLVLLVPTTLMGASLPLLSRHVSETGGGAARRVGLLYAANTAGSIVGTVLAGFVLIGGIGVASTTRLAALMNVAAGLGALALSRIRRRDELDSPTNPPGVERAPSTATVSFRERRAVLIVIALAGFAGLALEVVWFRLLLLIVPATSYAFSTMLAIVLLGIAAGAAIAAARIPRSPDPLRTLARMQIATAVLVPLSMAALAYTYSIGWKTSGTIQACVVAMLPATTLMGATFPYALAIWLRGAETRLASRVGVLYAINVCGAVLGSAAGAFVLLPIAGGRRSLLILAALYAAAGCAVAIARGGKSSTPTVATAGVLVVLTAFVLPDLDATVLARRYGRGEQPVFHAEGVQTTVRVHRQAGGTRVLYLDGLHQANDSESMVRLHAEIGHLPMMLHPDPQRALVIGLGGGVTAGAVAMHPHTQVDVVELSSTVVAAATLFSHANGDVLTRPNVRLRVDDGRNYLALTDQRYDAVTADIIQPIHAGAGNLYSVEYFRLARSVLRPGGVMLQWIGHRESEHYRLIMRTFLEAFPDATLWSGGALMVGGLEPLRISRETYERRLANPDVRFALTRIGLDTFDALLNRFTASADEMRRFVGSGPILTDDRPALEFHRSVPGSPPIDVGGLRGDVSRHVMQR
jgi:spermidine synthase